MLSILIILSRFIQFRKLSEMNEKYSPFDMHENDKHFTVNNEVDLRNVAFTFFSTTNFFRGKLNAQTVGSCEYNQIGRIGICISKWKWMRESLDCVQLCYQVWKRTTTTTTKKEGIM